MAAALPAATPFIAPPGVFKGRELTRKDRRLGATLEPVNALLEGGIPRGRISEVIGPRGCGKTSLAAAFISNATRRGEVTAVIDLANSFDPATMADGGVELSRVLWVHPGHLGREYKTKEILEVNGMLEVHQDPCPLPHPLPDQGEGTDRKGTVDRRRGVNQRTKNFLRAAELVLEAGGFGLLVMDFDESAFTLASSSALRLARMAERSGTAVLMLVTRPLCGTFAAVSLDLISTRAIFSRSPFGLRMIRTTIGQTSALKGIRPLHAPLTPSPVKSTGEGWGEGARSSAEGSNKNPPSFSNIERALFEGIEIKASIRRNKVGRSGLSAQWRSLMNPSDLTNHLPAPPSVRRA